MSEKGLIRASISDISGDKVCCDVNSGQWQL